MSNIDIIPCPFCGKADIGVREELLDISFESGNTVKIAPYCKYCGAVGRSRTIHDCDKDVKFALAVHAWNERFLFASSPAKWNSSSNCVDEICCDIPIGQLCCFKPLNSDKILFAHMAGMVVDRFKDMSFIYVLKGHGEYYFSRNAIICPAGVYTAYDAKKYFQK